MAISLFRFEKPLAVEKFADSQLDTKVRYSTRRADSFVIDGTIAPEANVFCHIALCDDKRTCDEATEELIREAKIIDGVAESIQLSLRPFMHRGTINWLDPVNPGPIFETHEKPPITSPVVILTSGGFVEPGTQMERVSRTITNTVVVAEDALKSNGLRFRRVFSLCGNFGDPITFTVWESENDMVKFAYRPGEHSERAKPQLDSDFHFDRTSFTRFTIDRAEGEWEGVRL
jgi:hypothetical protein